MSEKFPRGEQDLFLARSLYILRTRGITYILRTGGGGIMICCTCNICPRAVEQPTEINDATTRENLSSGLPTKRISNQSPRLNRLARKLKFRS